MSAAIAIGRRITLILYHDSMERLSIGKEGDRELLLIPGNDLAAEFYVPLAESLARRRVRSTLLTLPGFYGQPSLGVAGWESMMAAVLAELDRSPPAILVGHSLGGLIALLAAAARPTVPYLVLMEPAIPPGKWIAQAAVRRYQRQVVDADRDRFVNWSGSFYRVHDLKALPPAVIELYLAIRRTSDPSVSRALVESLPELYPLPFDRVRASVLLLHGDSSGWATKLGLLYLARQLPQLERETIPRCAHWMANEQDELIADAIARLS